MSWQPGQRIVTTQDKVEWESWRRERRREQQRYRRSRNPRIDYYPDEGAAEIIYGLCAPIAGRDLSSVINRIVAEWATATGINKG